MALAKWLLQTAVCISIISLASAGQTTVTQTVQNTQTKYRISVLTQTSTLVETTYDILTFTPPPVIEPEYIPYTVYRGTTTVSVTPAAITEVITGPGITADITSIITVTITAPEITVTEPGATLDITNIDTLTITETAAAITVTQPAATLDITNIDTLTITETAAAITVTQPAATLDITNIDTLTITETAAAITVTQPAATLDITNIDTLTITETAAAITITQPAATLDVTDIETLTVTQLGTTTTTVVIPPPPPSTVTSTETVGGITVTVSGGACSSTSLAASSSSLQSSSASSLISVVSSSAAGSSVTSGSGAASSTSGSSSAASSSGAAQSSLGSSSTPGTTSSMGSTSLVSSSTASPVGSSGALSTTTSSNPAPTCAIAESGFIIAVEEQNTATRYLIPASDSALTELDFTSSAQSAAVFSLNGPNDSAENLDFSLVDGSQDTVVLYPAQESGEGGQQAVYFATASIISGGGIALTARLNSDCTISLLLPNSTSNNLYDCSIDDLPQLYLLTNGQGPENCVQVTLAVLPVPGPASSSSIAAPSATSNEGSPSSSASAPVSSTSLPASSSTGGSPSSSTSTVASPTSAPGSSTFVPGSSTSAPGSPTSVPSSSISAPGSSTSLPGSSTSAPGSSTSILGSSTLALGSSTLLSSSTSTLGSSTLAPGSSTSLPGSSTSILGSSTLAPGSSTLLSSSTSILGSSTLAPGSSTMPSSSTSAPGSSTLAPGSSTIPSSLTSAFSSSIQISTSAVPSTTSSMIVSTTSTTTTSTTAMSTSATSTTTTSTTSTTSSTTTHCSPIPSLFNIVVVEPGSGTQYLADVNVAGGLTEDYWGYDKLPVTSSLSSAAIFSVDAFNRLTENVYLEGKLTEVYAAVRISAIGDSILQLYPSNHFNPADMTYYSAKVNGTCAFNIFVHGANIAAICGGELSILSERYQRTRGVTCTVVQIHPIPYVAPTSVSIPYVASTSITTLATVTSSVSAASSTAPTCVLPSYFTILVNMTGAVPQYLWDPNSDDDEALSFTTDPAQSLIFTLTPGTNQLQFNVSDLYDHTVTLVSEQDMQNAGNEAVFFTTSLRFIGLGYLPVVATLLPDCSLGLTLPYDAANTLAVCEGTLWLVLNPNDASGCTPVKLDIIPYV